MADVNLETTTESSTVEIDVNAASSTATDVNQQVVENADSSSSEIGAPKTAFEAVMQVLNKDKAGNEGADESGKDKNSDGANADAKVDGAKADDSTGEETDDELLEQLDPKSKASKRIRELIAVRDELEPAANNFVALQNWTRESGLTAEEFSTGLQIMAAMRGDPHKALELIAPYYLQLQQVTGEILPEDIQKMVDDGTIASVEVAKELAKNRSKAAHLAQQAEQAEQQNQDRAAYQASNEVKAALMDEATKWDAAWQQSDPDYEHKQPLVLMAIQNKVNELVAAGTPPKTRQDVRKISDDARRMVEERLRVGKPQKKEIKPVTNAHKQITPSAPKTSYEAAQLALKGGSAS